MFSYVQLSQCTFQSSTQLAKVQSGWSTQSNAGWSFKDLRPVKLLSNVQFSGWCNQPDWLFSDGSPEHRRPSESPTGCTGPSRAAGGVIGGRRPGGGAIWSGWVSSELRQLVSTCAVWHVWRHMACGKKILILLSLCIPSSSKRAQISPLVSEPRGSRPHGGPELASLHISMRRTELRSPPPRSALPGAKGSRSRHPFRLDPSVSDGSFNL